MKKLRSAISNNPRPRPKPTPRPIFVESEPEDNAWLCPLEPLAAAPVAVPAVLLDIVELASVPLVVADDVLELVLAVEFGTNA